MGLSWFSPSCKLLLFSALTVPLFLQLLHDIAKFSHTHAHIISFVWNSRTCISGHPRGMGGGGGGCSLCTVSTDQGYHNKRCTTPPYAINGHLMCSKILLTLIFREKHRSKFEILFLVLFGWFRFQWAFDTGGK